MDYPITNNVPLHISSWSGFTAFMEVAQAGVGNWAGASLTWVANRALYIPLLLPFQYPVKRVFWANGSSPAGNADFGLYTRAGGQIYHTGSTACSGASTLQYVTPSSDFILPPGMYFMAISFSGTTSVAYGSTNGNTSLLQREAGCYQQATALPLPSSATFASFSSNLYPLCGITRTASGF